MLNLGINNFAILTLLYARRQGAQNTGLSLLAAVPFSLVIISCGAFTKSSIGGATSNTGVVEADPAVETGLISLSILSSPTESGVQRAVPAGSSLLSLVAEVPVPAAIGAAWERVPGGNYDTVLLSAAQVKVQTSIATAARSLQVGEGSGFV